MQNKKELLLKLAQIGLALGGAVISGVLAQMTAEKTTRAYLEAKDAAETNKTTEEA